MAECFHHPMLFRPCQSIPGQAMFCCKYLCCYVDHGSQSAVVKYVLFTFFGFWWGGVGLTTCFSSIPTDSCLSSVATPTSCCVPSSWTCFYGVTSSWTLLLRCNFFEVGRWRARSVWSFAEKGKKAIYIEDIDHRWIKPHGIALIWLQHRHHQNVTLTQHMSREPS